MQYLMKAFIQVTNRFAHVVILQSVVIDNRLFLFLCVLRRVGGTTADVVCSVREPTNKSISAETTQL